MNNRFDAVRQIVNELRSLEANPRVHVATAHILLEYLTNELAKIGLSNAAKVTGDSRTYTHAVKLTLLHEKGILNDEQYSNLNNYRKIRNKAVHEWEFVKGKEKEWAGRFKFTRTPEGLVPNGSVPAITAIGGILICDLLVVLQLHGRAEEAKPAQAPRRAYT